MQTYPSFVDGTEKAKELFAYVQSGEFGTKIKEAIKCSWVIAGVAANFAYGDPDAGFAAVSVSTDNAAFSLCVEALRAELGLQDDEHDCHNFCATDNVKKIDWGKLAQFFLTYVLPLLLAKQKTQPA